MRLVPLWVRMTLWIAVCFAGVGIFLSNIAKVPERKTLGLQSEHRSVQASASLRPTPAATATALSFPARGKEAAVETIVYRDSQGDPIDEEFCKRVAQLNPQTVAEAIALYEVPVDDNVELVPLGAVDPKRIEMIPYYRCVDDHYMVEFAQWAFVVYDGPPTRVKVPEGGHITWKEGLEQKIAYSGEIVEQRSMTVRGVVPSPSK